MKEFYGKGDYSVELPDLFLRHPPVAEGDKVIFRSDYLEICIDNPISAFAWKMLLTILKYGDVEKMDGEFGLKVSIDKEWFLALMETADYELLRENLKKLRECGYTIKFYENGRKRKEVGFVLLSSYELFEEGRFYFWLDRHFIFFIQERPLWFYFVFAHFLKKPSAMNLHAFLSTNTSIREPSIQTLLERARITTKYEPMARKYLAGALDELVSVGFLKGYHIDTKAGKVILERYDKAVLQIKALELKNRLEQKARENLEKFRKIWRESKRRQRARKKNDLSF